MMLIILVVQLFVSLRECRTVDVWASDRCHGIFYPYRMFCGQYSSYCPIMSVLVRLVRILYAFKYNIYILVKI